MGLVAPLVQHLRLQLADLGLLPSAAVGPADVFDEHVEKAVRELQAIARGCSLTGVVGNDTADALQEAGQRLGGRFLYHSVSHPFVGDDVLELQSKLADMGFDVGRCDGIFGRRTEEALREFQDQRGLVNDGACGPMTLRELELLQRVVVGGRPLRAARV